MPEAVHMLLILLALVCLALKAVKVPEPVWVSWPWAALLFAALAYVLFGSLRL